MSFLFSTVGSSISTPADNGTNSVSLESGVRFTLNSDVTSISATISDNTSGLTTATVQANNGGADIASTDVSGLSAGDRFTISFSGTSGTTYELVGDAGGSSYTRGQYSGTSIYPFTSADFDLDAGVYSDGGSSSQDLRYTFNDFEVTL